MSKNTMKAVVFKGTLKVEIEDRPIPKIVEPTDIIIKVRYSALCGRYAWVIKGVYFLADTMTSELHVFRGHQPSKTDFIMVGIHQMKPSCPG